MLKDHVIAGGVISIYILFNSVAIAAGVPRACENTGVLSAGIKGVINDSKNFFIYEGEQYGFRVFSLKGKDPTSPNRWCVRYEILNTGRKEIQNFSWRDIGMKSKNLLPGKQSTPWVITDTVLDFDEPVPVRSIVSAFGDSKANVRALFLKYPTYDKTPSVGGQYSLSYFDSDKMIPAGVAALRDAKFRVVPAVAVKHPDNAIDFLPLVSKLQSNDIEIEVSSKASYGKDGYYTVTEITAKSSDRSPVRLTAPTIQTLKDMSGKEAFQKVSLEKQVAYFAESFQSFRNTNLLLKDGSFESTFAFPAIKDKEQTLFIIRYPLKVDTVKGGTFCVNAIAYSPVPVSSDGRGCDTGEPQ